MTTKTTKKTKTPKTDPLGDLLRAHGLSEKAVAEWSRMLAKGDSMKLPDGDDTMRIANMIGWTDLSDYSKEYMSLTTPEDVKDFLDANDGGDVTFLLNTPGGSVFGGIEIANMILGYEGKTTAIVTGVAASVGSLMAAACNEVLMMEASMVMIHGPHTFGYGGSIGLQRHRRPPRQRSVSVASTIYKKRMDDDTVDTMLADGGDHYLTPARSSRDAGFADSIYTEPSDGDDGDDDTRQNK